MDQQNTVMNLTADGLRLYNKVQRGAATLNLTRIVVGDGELAENETAYDLVALKRAVEAVTEIIKNDEIGDGTTRLTIRILSSVIDYYLREIGIIALDPDEGEILYAYCNFGEYADYIRTFNGVVATTQEIDIYIQIGNAPDMVVNVTDALVVTPKDLREHTDNKENPHGVTAAQLGLNKALLDTITEQRLLNHDSAFNASHRHDNMAILAAITQAVIAGWNAGYNHSLAKGNPHNTTKSDIGLGNVTNESKATMFSSPTFTGTPKAPTPASGTNNTQIATTAFVQSLYSELSKKITAIGKMVSAETWSDIASFTLTTEEMESDDWEFDGYTFISGEASTIWGSRVPVIAVNGAHEHWGSLSRSILVGWARIVDGTIQVFIDYSDYNDGENDDTCIQVSLGGTFKII